MGRKMVTGDTGMRFVLLGRVRTPLGDEPGSWDGFEPARVLLTGAACPPRVPKARSPRVPNPARENRRHGRSPLP
ncbi:hypothetical protein GCM10010349_62430 [Streptomyces flavofungini]|nr:hypothetical protein GCM10010349_62430 [Streptomyces flavofungini]